jgi:hypothetical protein
MNNQGNHSLTPTSSAGQLETLAHRLPAVRVGFVGELLEVEVPLG